MSTAQRNKLQWNKVPFAVNQNKKPLKSQTQKQHGGFEQAQYPDRPIAPRCLDQLEMGSKLGSGKFGKVYMMREKASKNIVAVKVMLKEQLIKCRLEKQFRREVEIMSALRHPNILGFYGWFHDKDRIYMVLEFALHGELYDLLKKQETKTFDEKTSALYVAQLASALHYCHEKNIIHRDLKPENVLVNEKQELKLADFGWAVHGKRKRETMCGTLDYLSPEMLHRKEYDAAIDRWMLGIMLYEFLYGNPPFEKDDGEKTKVAICGCSYTFPEQPKVSDSAKDLLTKLLVKNPLTRLSLTDVLQHPFLVENVDPVKLVELRKLAGIKEREVLQTITE